MKILCETSMRHVHLTKQDVETLFGKGAKLESVRDLSQPGQFLAKQRVTLVGSKDTIQNVGIIGPVRSRSQIEISRTDAFKLGLKDVPVRLSGDLDGAPVLTVLNLPMDKSLPPLSVGNVGTIIAKRHIHLDPKTAKENNFFDGETVGVKFGGERGATLGEVIVRIDSNFRPALHIDSDEANAVIAGDEAEIIK